MSETGESSFLAGLLKKKADMLRIGAETGINTGALVNEADRQIKQVAGTPEGVVRGIGVTKSGEED